MHKTITLAGAVVLLSLTSGTAFPQAVYRLTDLGRRGGIISGTDINESGQVTGFDERPLFVVQGFLWSGKRILDLGTLGGESSRGVVINASGQVAGVADTSEGDGHAFLWDRGIMQDLGTLGGTVSDVRAINDAGQVTGTSSLTGDFTQPQHAFLWDGATMRDLGTLGGRESFVTGMNALGQVTGGAQLSNGSRHAFLFDGKSMKDLGTLGGSGSSGSAINDSGWVTGGANTTNGSGSHAFLWDGETMRDLGTLGGMVSHGWAINAAGQVAGDSLTGTPGDGQHAFLWDGSSMHDLGTLGGPASSSKAINAAGQVTGFSWLPGFDIIPHNFHAFLWDSGTLHDLNDLVDPADPLKSHVSVEFGFAINDAGYILATGFDSRTPTETPSFLLSPATPDDLRAKNVMTGGNRVVRLAWSDSFVDETRFLIERSPVVTVNNQCGAFTTIGSRGENVTVFRDTTVSPNTNYCYQLRVVRSTVVHTLSNIARIKTNQ